MTNNNNEYPKSFKLSKAGDFAIVRLLHSSVSTIEIIKTHWLQKGDTWKHFKCVGDNCPACAIGNSARERAYIRLFDYGSGEVEVWDRTNNKKFFDSLSELEKDWGKLDDIVVKITRESDEFPTYAVVLQPSKNYAKPDNVAIDEKIAYRMAASRSAEDIQTFINTGIMPPKKSQSNNSNTYTSNNNNNKVEPIIKTESKPFEIVVDEDDGDLPF